MMVNLMTINRGLGTSTLLRSSTKRLFPDRCLVYQLSRESSTDYSKRSQGRSPRWTKCTVKRLYTDRLSSRICWKSWRSSRLWALARLLQAWRVEQCQIAHRIPRLLRQVWFRTACIVRLTTRGRASSQCSNNLLFYSHRADRDFARLNGPERSKISWTDSSNSLTSSYLGSASPISLRNGSGLPPLTIIGRALEARSREPSIAARLAMSRFPAWLEDAKHSSF